jgi:hypothetical protein
LEQAPSVSPQLAMTHNSITARAARAAKVRAQPRE